MTRELRGLFCPGECLIGMTPDDVLKKGIILHPFFQPKNYHPYLLLANIIIYFKTHINNKNIKKFLYDLFFELKNERI